MGLLSALFGESKKIGLVRSLVWDRVAADSRAAAHGFTKEMVNSLTDAQLLGLPEATIATIVESYASLAKRGSVGDEALRSIERHRAQIGTGRLPDPLTLESYVRYRLDIEHPDGSPIDDRGISASILICRMEFGIVTDPGTVQPITRSLTPLLQAAELEREDPSAARDTTYRERYLQLREVVRGFAEGEITEEEFFDAIEGHLEDDM